MLANTENENTLNGNHLHSDIVSKFTDDIQGHFQSTRERAEGFVKDHPYVTAALEQYESRGKAPASTLATVPESTERVLLTRREVPEKAPALWAEAKQPGDTPPVFIQRYYGPWIGKGLSRPDLDRLDHTLYVALGRWLEKPGNTLPFDLPSKRELMKREAAQGMPETVRDARRLSSRWQRRQGLTP